MIAVVDSGMGNLRSIAKALEEVGGAVRVTRDVGEISRAERIVLPGVGAFGDGMKSLQRDGLNALLTEQVLGKKKPFLGICLGMQLLAKSSEEFGHHEGLGWINAQVRQFQFPSSKDLKVPHVGWNTVTFSADHPMRRGIEDQADFYFVHSYYVLPADPSLVLGTCDYGRAFAACIVQGNIVATQFHPEKSQRDGLTMLRNFLHWQPC